MASSLLTAQEHRLHKVLVPVSLGSLPAGDTAPARRAPCRPGTWETRGDSHSSSDPGSLQMHTVLGGPARARGGRRGAAAPGDALVRAPRGPVAGGAPLSRGLGGSAPELGLGSGPRSALPPPGRPGPAGSRESGSSAPTARLSTSFSSASFSRSLSHNRFRLAGVPRNEERRGGGEHRE